MKTLLLFSLLCSLNSLITSARADDGAIDSAPFMKLILENINKIEIVPTDEGATLGALEGKTFSEVYAGALSTPLEATQYSVNRVMWDCKKLLPSNFNLKYIQNDTKYMPGEGLAYGMVRCGLTFLTQIMDFKKGGKQVGSKETGFTLIFEEKTNILGHSRWKLKNHMAFYNPPAVG